MDHSSLHPTFACALPLQQRLSICLTAQFQSVCMEVSEVFTSIPVGQGCTPWVQGSHSASFHIPCGCRAHILPLCLQAADRYTLPFIPLLKISSGELLEKNLPPFLLLKSSAVGTILLSAYFIPLAWFFKPFQGMSGLGREKTGG